MFMDDHTDAQIAPSGDFSNTSYLNCDNPLLSAQAVATICAPDNTFIRPGVVNPTTGLPSPLANRADRPAQRRRRRSRRRSRAYRLPYRRRHARATCSAACRTTPTISSARHACRDLLQRLLGHAPAARDRRRRQSGHGGVAGVPVGAPVCRSAIPGGGDPNCVPYDIFTTGGVSRRRR